MVQWIESALSGKWIWSGGIKADVKLIFIEPFQIVCLSDFYNYIKSFGGHEIIRNGCLRSGTADAINCRCALGESAHLKLSIEAQE